MSGWLLEPIYWNWWLLGVVLMAVEAIAPGFFFLWMGVAALLVGLLLTVLPELAWTCLLYTSTFDVQRDHAELLRQALRLLAPGGMLIFSTNHRKFRLDCTALSGLQVEDWSRRTLPPDFERDPKIHRCWKITQP